MYKYFITYYIISRGLTRKVTTNALSVSILYDIAYLKQLFKFPRQRSMEKLDISSQIYHTT